MRRAICKWFAAPAACVIGLAGPPSVTVAATAASTGKIITVSGPIDPGALGRTLPHEHIFIDGRVREDTPQGWAAAGLQRPTTSRGMQIYDAPLTMSLLGEVAFGVPNKDNAWLGDEQVAVAELQRFKRFGGQTIVDVTSLGLQRDPQALQRVAQATGINVIMGSSWFQAQWAGKGFRERSIESLTEEIVRDITVGVGDTGIRAGIIGEVLATNPEDAEQRKILHASARASRTTGAAISVHGGEGSQLETLQALVAAGAEPSRIALGASLIGKDTALLKRILERGAYVQFDSLGDWPHVDTKVSDHDLAVAVTELIKLGFVERILLSQDVHEKSDLTAYGGGGYAFVLKSFVPYLKRLGVTDAQIDTIVIENPRRLLTLAAPKK